MNLETRARMQEESRIARKLSALEDMGFERVDASPVVLETTFVGNDIHRITCTKPAMGTLVAITALGYSKDQLEEAIGCAFEEMDRLVAMLSRYESSSAVASLNAHGRLNDVPPEFACILSRSLQFHELTREAFDITVEPIVDLFRRSFGGSTTREPTQAELAETLESVGSRHIDIETGSVRFDRSGMEISLNGIAKGYIVDAAARVLEEHGIGDYLINAGGDIRTAGAKENGLPWTVAVQDPSKHDEFPDTIRLGNAAVATSGCYEKSFDRAERFHHIVDSKDGRSPGLNSSVTVVAPSAMVADALATGIFVMSPHPGIRLVETLPGCECLVIDRNGRMRKSRGWNMKAPINAEEVDL